MNSSPDCYREAERWLVKPMVESSNLSSSSKNKMESVRMDEKAVLKTVDPKGSGGSIPSLSTIFIGELAER